MVAYENKFQIYNVLTPDQVVQTKECELSINSLYHAPKVVFDDRIVILRSKDGKLIFYDIQRKKFIAKCEIEDIYRYYVYGDELIIKAAG